MKCTAFAAAFVAAGVVAGCGSTGDSPSAAITPKVPSPIPVGAIQPGRDFPAIPEGVLPIESVASKPPPDPDIRWIRTDGANLPTHLTPCRTKLPSDRDRVAGRQIVATPTDAALAGGRPPLWKSVRLVVYRDVAAARDAVAELRTALATCARHDEPDGSTTVWQSQPLKIGEEAMFVGGQMYRGDTALHAHYRGVVVRQRRAIATYLDFGPMTTPPTPAETKEQQDDAHIVAERLATATWLDGG